MAITAVTDNTFNEQVLEIKDKLIVVDFWAEWCGPCRMLTPVLEAVSEKLSPQVSILKLNTDENINTAQKYEITSIPCNILFKDGKEVHRIIGHKSQSAFEAELSPYL